MNIDKNILKLQVNILPLAENLTELRRVSSTNGGEWAGPCPFCPEHGVDRFHVQPNAPGGGIWLCRYCTNGKWCDVFEFIKRRDKIDFFRALKVAERYTKDPERLLAATPVPALSKPVQTAIPSAKWQSKGMEFVQKSTKTLLSDAGRTALKYLHDRGLNDQTIEKYRLGYHPGDHNHGDSFDRDVAAWDLENSGIGAVHMPAGIVIPNLLGDMLFGLKIRRIRQPIKSKESKYEMIKGSRQAIFGASNFFSSRAILTEGEFDAMLLDQEAGDLIGIATLGSAGTRINNLDSSFWFPYLFPLMTIYLVYDADKAGNTGFEALQSASNRFVQLLLPGGAAGKDVTDLWKSGVNLREWIKKELQINSDPDKEKKIPTSISQDGNSITKVIDLNAHLDEAFRIDPTRPCYWCGGVDFRAYPNNGGFVCNRCHPLPETRIYGKVYLAQ